MAKTSVVDALASAAKGFTSLPLIRQVILLAGLSASIAIAISLANWSSSPNYRPLYSHLSAKELSGILDILDESHIKYKLDPQTNGLSIPTNKVSVVRLKLAAAGLPKGASVGFEILDKEQGLTTSRFLENARYKRALEGELARTILNMEGVEGVRVHLALPRESSFLDDKQEASASVLLDLDEREQFSKSNVGAITRLVASSIPGLVSGNVTVVDQSGRLLTLGDDNDGMVQTKEQFEYKRRLESVYERRIESLLIPLLGADKVRAKVAADIDFTRVEQTQENYNPETVVRSEETYEERALDNSLTGGGSGGVPGALMNRPPSNGQSQITGSAETKEESSASRKQTTRNFEVAKTISHTQAPTGMISKLSVAVLVDDYEKMDAGGKVTRSPVPAPELDKITTLVKNVVGFSNDRGDEITVINSTFAPVEELTSLPTPTLLEQAWFWQVVKMSLSGLGIILLIFFVLRPVMKGLTVRSEEEKEQALAASVGGGGSLAPPIMVQGGAMVNPAAVGGFGGAMNAAVQGPRDMNALRQMADQDPERIAQVMKKWVGE